MKKKFSLAPWRACHEGECVCGMIFSIPEDIPIVTILSKDDGEYTLGDGLSRTSDEYKANAKLVSAAPDLLDALEEMLTLFDHPRYKIRFNKQREKAVENAKKAVHKAYTGETHYINDCET